jgi:hypothetical protein
MNRWGILWGAATAEEALAWIGRLEYTFKHALTHEVKDEFSFGRERRYAFRWDR